MATARRIARTRRIQKKKGRRTSTRAKSAPAPSSKAVDPTLPASKNPQRTLRQAGGMLASLGKGRRKGAAR